MKYEVINLKTDESHGEHESLYAAHGCVIYDHLTHYQIWYGDTLSEECESDYQTEQYERRMELLVRSDRIRARELFRQRHGRNTQPH